MKMNGRKITTENIDYSHSWNYIVLKASEDIIVSESHSRIHLVICRDSFNAI